jgi:hypothetical protein
VTLATVDNVPDFPFYQMAASGQMYCIPPGGTPEYTGTGSVYMKPNIVVTAGHCVPQIEGARYAVKMPTNDYAWIAERAVWHEESDIAVLVGRPDVDGPPRVYSGVDETLTEAGDFVAFGFPAEENAAVARHFKGHFQRYFGYPGPSGQKYFAGEMSIPAPAGLSGGPVSYPHSRDKLAAVVTTNHDSYFVVDSFEETEHDGTRSRGEIRRVVSYGIAAMLSGKASWLSAIVDSAD